MKNKLVFGEVTVDEGLKSQCMFNIPGTELTIPVTIINGNNDGMLVTIISGIHGGEYVGIETANRLADEILPNMVNGGLIVIHTANVPAFLSRVSYVNPNDQKNLNRLFPGKKDGTESEKLAYFIMNQFIKCSDFLIDLHGGDLHESLVPFIAYSNLSEESVTNKLKEAVQYMGIEYILGVDVPNTTFSEAAHIGIPGFLAELGKCGRWSLKEVISYLSGLKNVLRYLGVLNDLHEVTINQTTSIKSMKSEIASCEGYWYSFVEAGDFTYSGQLIGEIRNSFGMTLCKYITENEGVMLYIATSLGIKKNDPIYAIGLL